MGKTRIEWIDLAKGVGIIMIVALHIGVVPADFSRMNAMWVPLFFFMSGLFFKPMESMKTMLLSKVNTILVPFIFFYLLSYVLFYAANLISPGLIKTDTTGILDIFIQEAYFNGPIWFLLSLFWDFIVMSLIYHFVAKELVRIVIIVTLTAIGLCCGYWHIFIPFKLVQAFDCIIFFYVGYRLADQVKRHRTIRTESLLAMGFWGIAVGLYLIFDRPGIDISPNFFSGNIVVAYLVIFLAILGTIALCKIIRHLPVISYFGRYSLIPLCLHHLLYRPILLINSRLLPQAINCRLSNSILTTVVTILIIWAMIPFCIKYIPQFCGQKRLFG